ncbi:hypothetical protein MRB53_013799 [Persea americana]|uniref:Uncharacterized protein n=1 Tax=Persea americana TaxID=3435 RepID=A0ACC2K9A0_PERAE|nr:hypothetical protein MRB53_013799 [Persea americana]
MSFVVLDSDDVRPGENVTLQIHQFCRLPCCTSGRACSNWTVVEFPVAAACSALTLAGEFSAEGTRYGSLEQPSISVIENNSCLPSIQGDIFIVDVAMMCIMAEDGLFCGRVCRIHQSDMSRLVQGILALSIKNLFLLWHST